MTKQEAIREETRRYVTACAAGNRHKAHIHALALGRLRGQTVAPWIHQADLSAVTL
jgi:hypothetical protein